jgi:hypothetical protein
MWSRKPGGKWHAARFIVDHETLACHGRERGLPKGRHSAARPRPFHPKDPMNAKPPNPSASPSLAGPMHAVAPGRPASIVDEDAPWIGYESAHPWTWDRSETASLSAEPAGGD